MQQCGSQMHHAVLHTASRAAIFCPSFAQKSAPQVLCSADVRTAVVKAGGKMADSGSVLFNFQRQGKIYVKGNASKEEEVWVSFADEFVKLCSKSILPSFCNDHALSI